MKPFHLILFSTAFSLILMAGRAETKPLVYRGSERREITPDEEIIDGQWVVIGSSEKAGASVTRDTDHQYKGKPVYHFSAAGDAVNRIEFSELFGSSNSLKNLSEDQVRRVVALIATDIAMDFGQYGDTVTYEWSTRFPGPLNEESSAIFAQWHGRPDRTMVNSGETVRFFSMVEFETLTNTVEFKENGWGFDRATGNKTDYRVESSAGGPIGAFKIGFNHMYLLFRSDASRCSSSDMKLKPKPTQAIGYHMQEGMKEASLVWKLPLSEVPLNEWIDFKVRIHYSEYAVYADKVLTPGSVTVWTNGQPVAEWHGNVGKNDTLGPYFKFGIYKPGPSGFKVDHAAYQRTTQRTRKSPPSPYQLIEK